MPTSASSATTPPAPVDREARNATILDLWRKGWSAGGIAMRIGCTRNTVIGVVHRGLAKRGGPPSMTVRRGEPPTSRPARPADLAARNERIWVLWAEGRTSGAIATAVGCTRNVVMGAVTKGVAAGKVLRRKEAADGSAGAEAPAPAPSPGPAPPPVAPIAPPPAPPPPTGFEFFPAARAMLPLTLSTCRWPLGDPYARDFRFCCAPVTVIGKPYCAEHADIAFTGTVRRLVPTARQGAPHGSAR